MASIGILTIGALAMASLQIFASRSNRFGDRMLQAVELTTDLQQNIARWSYTDARLSPLAQVTSTTDSQITARWDMGMAQAASYQAQYSDTWSTDTFALTNAAANNQLCLQPGSTACYQGQSNDVDGDGIQDFTRYWTVFEVNFSGSGNPNGKLVQIITRWVEPAIGYRQVSETTFIRNPASVF